MEEIGLSNWRKLRVSSILWRRIMIAHSSTGTPLFELKPLGRSEVWDPPRLPRFSFHDFLETTLCCLIHEARHITPSVNPCWCLGHCLSGFLEYARDQARLFRDHGLGVSVRFISRMKTRRDETLQHTMEHQFQHEPNCGLKRASKAIRSETFVATFVSTVGKSSTLPHEAR